MKTYSNSILSAEDVKRQFEEADQAFQIKLEQLEQRAAAEREQSEQEARHSQWLAKIGIGIGLVSLVLNVLQLTNVL